MRPGEGASTVPLPGVLAGDGRASSFGAPVTDDPLQAAHALIIEDRAERQRRCWAEVEATLARYGVHPSSFEPARIVLVAE